MQLVLVAAADVVLDVVVVVLVVHTPGVVVGPPEGGYLDVQELLLHELPEQMLQ